MDRRVEVGVVADRRWQEQLGVALRDEQPLGRLVVGARPVDELTALVNSEIETAKEFVAKNGGAKNPYAAMQAAL